MPSFPFAIFRFSATPGHFWMRRAQTDSRIFLIVASLWVPRSWQEKSAVGGRSAN